MHAGSKAAQEKVRLVYSSPPNPTVQDVLPVASNRRLNLATKLSLPDRRSMPWKKKEQEQAGLEAGSEERIAALEPALEIAQALAVDAERMAKKVSVKLKNMEEKMAGILELMEPKSGNDEKVDVSRHEFKTAHTDIEECCGALLEKMKKMNAHLSESAAVLRSKNLQAEAAKIDLETRKSAIDSDNLGPYTPLDLCGNFETC